MAVLVISSSPQPRALLWHPTGTCPTQQMVCVTDGVLLKARMLLQLQQDMEQELKQVEEHTWMME